MQMLRFSLPFIFLLVLAACNNNGTTSTATENNTTEGRSGLHIVHVKSDSLQTGYTALAKELARLEENITKAQENLAKEGNALQAEINRLQNKAQQGLLSPNQIQSEQQRIARKEQDIMQKREIAMASIQQEQIALQTKFAERVKAILEELQAEKGYDYILNQGAGSGVLITNDTYDITDLVLQRLNAAGEDVLSEEASDDTSEEATSEQ